MTLILTLTATAAAALTAAIARHHSAARPVPVYVKK